MRRMMEKLGLTEDLLVTLVFGAMLVIGLLLGGTALYQSSEPLATAVPPVFAAPEQFAGRSGVAINGVIRRWVEPGSVLEVVPMAGGMLQPDPPLLVVLGPGAQDTTVRPTGQEVQFWGTVITRAEDVPPGAVLTPEAERLLQEGQLFYYAEST